MNSTRRFRWQLILVALAIVVFGFAILFRILSPILFPNNPQPQVPTATITPINLDAVPIEVIPTFTPQPTRESQNVTETEQNTNDLLTFREALIGKLERINPLYALDNSVDEDITSLIFEGLVDLNEYGEPVPGLARDWRVTSDGLEYVLFLRDDILWQDGTPFTATDVAFTASILSSPNFDGPESLTRFWRTVETSELNEYTVRFRLAQPLGSFPYQLTVGILPEHVLQGTTPEQLVDHPFNFSPIGTGPYQLEALRSTDNLSINVIDLQVAPTYLAREDVVAPFQIQRIRFRVYDNFDQVVRGISAGEVDGYAARDISERVALLNIPNTSIISGIEPTLGVLIFNWDEPDDQRFFRERRVRIALQAGFDRAGIVTRNFINTAVVADSPILTTSSAYYPSLEWGEFDPEIGFELLENAVERLARQNSRTTDEEDTDIEVPEPTPIPEDGIIRSFSILVADSPAYVSIANEIATQWAQFRLDVLVEVVDEETFVTRLESGEFDVTLVELPLSANPDVYPFWHQGQYPDGLNYGGASDDRSSELLELARRESNGINRMNLYHEFQQLFVERAVAIPLYHPLFTYVVTNRLDQVQIAILNTPSDRFASIGEWQIQR